MPVDDRYSRGRQDLAGTDRESRKKVVAPFLTALWRRSKPGRRWSTPTANSSPVSKPRSNPRSPASGEMLPRLCGSSTRRMSLLRMKPRLKRQETKSPSVPQSAAINSTSDGLFVRVITMDTDEQRNWVRLFAARPRSAQPPRRAQRRAAAPTAHA